MFDRWTQLLSKLLTARGYCRVRHFEVFPVLLAVFRCGLVPEFSFSSTVFMVVYLICLSWHFAKGKEKREALYGKHDRK